MLRPRFVIATFFSGSKGGTGKSTLAANLAIAMSQSLRSNVLLIDLGIDSSQTASRTLGIVPERLGALDFLIGSINDANQLLSRSTYLPSVLVVPPGNVRSYQLTINVNELFNRWVYLINSLVMATGSQLVLVDLPANAPTPILIPALVTSQIINIVLDHATYSEYVIKEIDDTYIQPMITQLRYRKIINVVLNKALPGLDTIESRVRGGFARNGEVFTIPPMSPIAQYLTATMKPAILYEPKGSLTQFKKAIETMTNAMTRQVKALLTGSVSVT
ncbi:ParA family protein [Vulcanisaeta distributa]|uniref:ParA family protein n=1 Tax=Vulcanisaeta distributa TaxID=164451 RepID=UPI0006CF28B9|nr:ParA family protein [Vulcanisaeta distributa]